MENSKITEITSTQNNLVKFVVKLQNPKFRKEQKLILIDGEKTISGLIADNVEFEYIFLKKGADFSKIKAKEIIFVNDAILKKISTVPSMVDAVGIIKEPEIDKNIFFNMKKIVLLDGIKDAGNLGTIIRSAAAFSMDGIILFNDCVDLYNTKTIRAAAQNMFKVPVILADIDFIKKLKKDFKIVSTVVDTKNDFLNHKFEEKFILAMGSEAQGLSEEIIKISDEKLTFFMDNNVESLNLAVCSSIAFAFIKLNQRFIPA